MPVENPLAGVQAAKARESTLAPARWFGIPFCSIDRGLWQMSHGRGASALIWIIASDQSLRSRATPDRPTMTAVMSDARPRGDATARDAPVSTLPDCPD
jgi:hypothetical protein